MAVPGGSDGEESACGTRDLGSVHGSGRPPGGGRGSPLQDSCLETPTDKGAWRAAVSGVTKSDRTEPLPGGGIPCCSAGSALPCPERVPHPPLCQAADAGSSGT